MRHKDADLLASMPVPKAFFRLAIPAVAAQLINVLYNLVDKMFIGHIPAVGKQALAGVGVTTPVILAISAFAALVSMGGAPKASILLGKGETEQAEKVMGSCTWMLLLLSALLTGIMLALGRPILLLFGASADTISFAADYMGIYCFGTLFTQLTLGLNAFIMNEYEFKVVWALSELGNVKWWHRNISRLGFQINGPVHAYPDIIVMLHSGKILMVETKGDHLDNDESKEKAKIGDQWAKLAGKQYKYYMVFETKQPDYPGAYSWSGLWRL